MSEPASADVLVVGAGESGTAVAAHLALAGVGRIGILDPERAVEAARSVNALSVRVLVEPYPATADGANADALVAGRSCVVLAQADGAAEGALREACTRAVVPIVTVGDDGDPVEPLRAATEVLHALAVSGPA